MQVKVWDYVTNWNRKWWYVWGQYMELEQNNWWPRTSWNIPKEWVSMWSDSYWSIMPGNLVKIEDEVKFKVGDYVWYYVG